MKVSITAESTIDLPKSLLDEYKIKILPFMVILGGEEFRDGENITPTDIFKFVQEKV